MEIRASFSLFWNSFYVLEIELSQVNDPMSRKNMAWVLRIIITLLSRLVKNVTKEKSSES